MTVAGTVTHATMKVATTQVWELLMTAQPASVRRYTGAKPVSRLPLGREPSGASLPVGTAFISTATHPRSWAVRRAAATQGSSSSLTTLSMTQQFPGWRISATRCLARRARVAFIRRSRFQSSNMHRLPSATRQLCPPEPVATLRLLYPDHLPCEQTLALRGVAFGQEDRERPPVAGRRP